LDEDINVAIRPMITPDATAEQEDGDRLVGGPIRECAGKLLDLNRREGGEPRPLCYLPDG
jgi:hypothetical protein